PVLVNGDGPAAFRAQDPPAGRQGGEDHVLKRRAPGQGKPGAFVDHPVEDLVGQRVRGGAEATGAAGAAEFDVHGFVLKGKEMVPHPSLATPVPGRAAGPGPVRKPLGVGSFPRIPFGTLTRTTTAGIATRGKTYAPGSRGDPIVLLIWCRLPWQPGRPGGTL